MPSNVNLWPQGRDSSVIRAPDSWLIGRGFESLQEQREIFFSRVDFLCWLLFQYPFHPCVTAVARKRSRTIETQTESLCVKVETRPGLGFYFADWSGFLLYRLWSGFLLYRLWVFTLQTLVWVSTLQTLDWVSHYLKATGDDGRSSPAAQLLLKDLLQQLLVVMIMADKAMDQGTQASLHCHPPWLVGQPKAWPCPHNDENTQNGPPKTCLTQQVDGIKTETWNQGFWLKLTCSC